MCDLRLSWATSDKLTVPGCRESMIVHSIWQLCRQRECKPFRKRKGMYLTEVLYHGERISVPKEVAEFLKQDRKRQRAEEKRDERHLSKGDLETVLSPKQPALHPLDDLVLKNLRLENLRKAVACLEKPKRELLRLRYEEELSMAAIGEIYGVSKMAISKQLKRVHKELRSSVW